MYVFKLTANLGMLVVTIEKMYFIVCLMHLLHMYITPIVTGNLFMALIAADIILA